MAYEASEIMFAAALLVKPKPEEYSSVSKLKTLMKKCKSEVEKNPKDVQFGNRQISSGFLETMDENKPDKLTDLAAGISAANAVRKYMGISASKNVTSYMTGNVWPKDVEKFKVSAFGFADYNSADVMVTADGKLFYGFSLKKKKKTTDASPTLINKAFDSLLIGKEFDSTKKELVDIRVDYFADLVIEAVKKKILLKKDIKNFDSLVRNNKKELFEAKQRDKNQFDKVYIDTKGWASADKGYKEDDTRNPQSMRFFVNSKLAEPKNPLFEAFVKVMNKNSQLFADSLLNIILKIKLFDEMDAKDLKKFQFDFALVTGVGYVRGNDVFVGQSSVVDLKTTLCGLSRLDKYYKNDKYKIVIDKEKSAKSNAAKIFLQLKRGTLVLLDLEIRYKGQFTPQPQFQGTLSQKFIEFLKKECDL